MSENLKSDMKRLNQLTQSREIVTKILDFGVSQYQILKIIEYLSLELEDRNTMLALTETLRAAIDASEQQIVEQKELIL